MLGQDGLGYAPLDEATAAVIPAQIAGWNGRPAEVPWRSMDDFLEAIDVAAVANAAVLMPQGNLRMMVVGHDDRRATPAEIVAMADLLGQALDAGAFGMSSGLTYTPGMYADVAELEALCRVVAERGGYWAPHTRSYGRAALDAYREAIEIGRRTGCPVHLTHATMNFAPNRGRAAELLALVDEATADGVDVTLDTYPYLPGRPLSRRSCRAGWRRPATCWASWPAWMRRGARPSASSWRRSAATGSTARWRTGR